MSIWHWLVVLLVIVLLFGAKKIPELAKGLGSGIKTFKKELEDDEDKKVEQTTTNAQTQQKNEKKPEVIEAQVIEPAMPSQHTQPQHAEKA